jgi:hypothetical protein
MNVTYYVHTKYWDEPFKFEDAADAEECSRQGYRVTAEVQV